MVNLVRLVLTAAAAAVMLAVPAGAGHAAAGEISETAGEIGKATVTLRLRENGVLHVTEKLTFTGGPITRTLLTRTRYDDANDRLYRISGVTGGRLDGDELVVEKSPATVEYDVAGVITPISGGEELRWYAVSGWSVPVREATVTVTTPAPLQSLTCFAGDLTAAVGCTTAEMDHNGTTAVFGQQDLAPGQALTVVVGLPARATGAAPILDRRFDLAAAFTLNGVTGGALALLLAGLLGGLGLVYWTRGRDARAVHTESGALMPVRAGRFVPPDGVRPGQIGTLIDEQADVIDVTATIVDLAVRNYLRIDEQPRQAYDAPDWLLVKIPRAPLNSLLPYERLLYDAIFDGRDAVLLSQLHGSFAASLGKVRDALYQDVVTQGWFARRPDTVRNRWTVLGTAVLGLGIVATVLLAWFTTYGLLGLALIIAGAAMTVGGQYMPAKTAKGSTVLAHTLGLREYLASGEIGDIPEAKRVELFSRYLPYAVVFDNVDRWARVVSSITGNGAEADNLYWYHGPAEWDLSKFADSMRTFTMTTSGAISASRQFRTI